MKICFAVVYSFSLHAAGADAMGHLRLGAPLRQAGIEIVHGVENGEILPERVSQGDVVIFQRHIPEKFDQYQKIVENARREGKPIIYELDDLLFALPENHPDRLDRAFAFSLLPMIQAVMDADLVIVSTQCLKKALAEYNPSIEVLPNYFDDTLWHFKQPVQKKMDDETIVIGYMGTESHRPDLEYITPVILNLIKHYPQKIRFHIWGVKPSLEMLSLPQVKWMPSHSFSYPEFANFFQTQSADIFIAPLVDSHFNRCKSPLKFFEYSALGAPGVFSNIETYSGIVVHGQNGFLASSLTDWEACLAQLIENDDLRVQLALRAQETIKENWLLSQNAFRWQKIFESIAPRKQSQTTLLVPIIRQQIESAETWRARVESQSRQIHQNEMTIQGFSAQVSQLTAQIAGIQNSYAAQVSQLTAQIAGIQNSYSWKLTQLLMKIRLKLFPLGSRREKWFMRLLRAGLYLKNYGLRSFARKFVDKINHRKVLLRSPVYTLGKRIYLYIPYKFRHQLLYWFYKKLGFLFAGMNHYENWRRTHVTNEKFNLLPSLIDMQKIDAAQYVYGKIAIHLHIFYPDLSKEFVEYLKNMPFSYDLYISVSDDDVLAICQRTFIDLPLCRNINILRVDNRGRDIAPIFCAFGDKLAGYDYIAHFHSKKSLYNKGATDGWREYLLKSLLGNPDRIRRIFSLLQGSEPHGIVYPQNYVFLPYWANTWLANRNLGSIWCARLGIENFPIGYFDYPAASMFWARGEALFPLFQADIALNDFPEESRQTDGTLAHTIERLFVLCSLKQGMHPGIIKDDENPSWSPWRFDQYINRAYHHILPLLNSPDIKIIAFDIFDTLFCRPLLNPETIKLIVARLVGSETSALYQEYRAIAEQQARDVKGLDVGLDEIYARLGELTGLSATRLSEIRRLEEKVEISSLEPRPEVLSLYKDALATGKPVVIITDMFLLRTTLEKVLHDYGITGWKGLFVSNDIGQRKDNGKLYEYVFNRFAISPAQMLMIGDNERSDVQIPIDMGASIIPLLRPTELARGLPRFSSIIGSHERKGDIDAEITLGLVIRKNFAPIQYQDFDIDSLVQVTPHNLGYSLVGPLLASFSQWLVRQAQADGIGELHFLSREGKFIKQIYDYWNDGKKNIPNSNYLVISRRAAGLAAVSSLEDILDIARTTYFPNTIENFLYVRYGLRLSDTRWREISQSLTIRRDSVISVQNRQIGHLIPLLKNIEAEIMVAAERERLALSRYLDNKGLNRDHKQAVVDIGYGGSAQGYLNKLLSQKVHGYYMMTDERSAKVTDAYGVFLRGCFYENIQQSSNAPTMLKYSFDLEKLLSVNEPQLEHYDVDSDGKASGHYRDLLPDELACADIKNQLLDGAMEYVKNARYICATMLPDFQPSCWTSKMLIESFLEQKSQREKEFLSQIVLDDYYCGRGLVS